jgi:acylphosphatase
MSATQRQRREIYYSGRVQGVGFRYTVRSLAPRFDVTGYVRNLPDGRVQVVVEGEIGEIDRFEKAILHQMEHYITGTNEIIGADSGQFDLFEIRY